MLSAKKLGIAGGVVWGGLLFLTTIACLYTGYADEWLLQWESVYPWYKISWKGSFAGLLFGFIDGFICLSIFGWIYNKL